MKCPSCGAEVQENTRCEYCGSFVKQDAAETAFDRSQEIISQRLAAANKRIIKMIIFAAILLTFISSLGLLTAFRFPIGSGQASDNPAAMTDRSTDGFAKLNSTADCYGNVTAFSYDGSITVKTADGSFQTELADAKLLQWLKDTGRSIEGVDILFSTDTSGRVRELALSSAVFFVLEKTGDRYLILRGSDFLSATSDVDLTLGAFYTGYFNYPDINIHAAAATDVFDTALFASVCDEKREGAVSDYYTGEDLTCFQIRINANWYYCSKEFYEGCAEGTMIKGDVCINDQLHLVYEKMK